MPENGGNNTRRVSRGDFREAVTADRQANSSDPKMRMALYWFRVCQFAMGDLDNPRRASRPLVIAYRLLTESMLGFELRPKTSVGPGLRIYHGFGLVVNDRATIGSGVTLRNGVTIGHRRPGTPSPRIGNNVSIGANACVIGDITLGDGAQVGAGAVVVHSIPPGRSAVGNPAGLITEKPMAAPNTFGQPAPSPGDEGPAVD